jgi:hypothetical protein
LTLLSKYSVPGIQGKEESDYDIEHERKEVAE